MTQKNFDTAKAKGEYGEQIVREILERKGFVVYQPITNKAHAFDIMAIRDKRSCIAMDVKAKSRRNKYPDTGVNEEHYQIYAAFAEKHQMPFWVVFVDEMDGKIYGNSLRLLDTPVEVGGINYPLIWKPHQGKVIRYWPLINMRHFADLTSDDMQILKSMNQRNHEFQPDNLPFSPLL